jgi:hypothetical protein
MEIVIIYKFKPKPMRVWIPVLLCLITLYSCSLPTKIIRYPDKRNEFFSNSSLRDYLLTNNNPKFVLRVSEPALNTWIGSNPKKTVNYFYSIMENELVKQGFSVKDRSTFNEIISRTNSSELLKKELSDADLILEVVNIDDKIVYSTNKVTNIGSNNSFEKPQSLEYRSLGAYVEYRLIMVKTNEIGGTYKFYYQPCAHGCALNDFRFSGKGKNRQVKLPQQLPQEVVENFIATSIKELVHSFKES